MISKGRIINGETKKRTAAAGRKIFLAVLVCGGRVIAAVALVLVMGFLSIKAMDRTYRF